MRHYLKIAVLTMSVIVLVISSGCILDDPGTNTTPTPAVTSTPDVTQTQIATGGKPAISDISVEKMIPQENLPEGFLYMATHKTRLNFGNITVNATEGIYKNKAGADLYVQIVKTENIGDTDELISAYKSQFAKVRYSPFEQVTVNGHAATMVKDYVLLDGQQVASYALLWENSNYVFLVSGERAGKDLITKMAELVGY